VNTAAENSRVVSRMLSDMAAFLDGPFAEPQSLADRCAHADVNATLEILRKRFIAATRWSAEQKSIEISGLHQPMYVEASPIKLLTALRHTTEFCLGLLPSETRVVVRAHYVSELESHIARLGEPHLVFNRPGRIHRLGYVCFDWQAGPVSRSIESIRQQFHAHPDDPRTGNLHMISLSLGEERCTILVHVSDNGTLLLHILAPVSE
jgi:hypothetical protein